MNHEKCMERENLFAYAQHLLESNEEREAREHVAQCARCREAVSAFQRLDAVLDEWKPAAPSPWFDARVRAAAEANPPARFPFGLFGVRWAQVLAPACLVVLVTFATLLIFRQQPSDMQERLTKSSATTVEEELTLYKDLPVLEDEDYEMLANFDVLSALPHGEAKVEN
jgi:anti-sigma factor RsiW